MGFLFCRESDLTRITLEKFKKALHTVLEDEDIEPKEIDEMAKTVMNLFGYDKSITDNLLSSGDRDIFYMLEDHDILSTEEESTHLPSGKNWRIHYWKLREDKIEEILKEEEKEEEEVEEEESVYNGISEEVWEREG